MNGGEEHEAILAAAMDAFERGCAQAAGGKTYSLAKDARETARAHYQEILEVHQEEIVAAFRSTDGMWRDAIATVAATGEAAFAEATARLALDSEPVVDASHFAAAAKRIETEKLASKAGSNWCGVANG
jgi:hypothetical protein